MPNESTREEIQELVDAVRAMAVACHLQNSEQITGPRGATGAVRMIQSEYLDLRRQYRLHARLSQPDPDPDPIIESRLRLRRALEASKKALEDFAASTVEPLIAMGQAEASREIEKRLSQPAGEPPMAARTIVGWRYRVLVNKHTGGAPLPGEIAMLDISRQSVYGSPGEWRYSDGPNKPDVDWMCDAEPLCAALTAKEST